MYKAIIITAEVGKQPVPNISSLNQLFTSLIGQKDSTTYKLTSKINDNVSRIEPEPKSVLLDIESEDDLGVDKELALKFVDYISNRLRKMYGKFPRKNSHHELSFYLQEEFPFQEYRCIQLEANPDNPYLKINFVLPLVKSEVEANEERMDEYNTSVEDPQYDNFQFIVNKSKPFFTKTECYYTGKSFKKRERVDRKPVRSTVYNL